MYKGHKLSKRLERYISYAKGKYHKECRHGRVDLQVILNEYEIIVSVPYCVQMYIYDAVERKGVYEGCYEAVEWVNGAMYIREVVGEVV